MIFLISVWNLGVDQPLCSMFMVGSAPPVESGMIIGRFDDND